MAKNNEEKRSPEDKLELAEAMAKQSEKIAARYEMVGQFFGRIFRWFSAWFDRIVFNPKSTLR